LIAVVAVVLTVTTGCIPIVREPGGGGSGRGGGIGRADMPTSSEADKVVRGALKDVERFWGTWFPRLSGGRPFVAVQGGYHPYTRRNPPPPCGQEQAAYQPNAFYCPSDDFIAWDSEQLIPQLQADFGPLLVGVVMAHEYGHAIQARLGLAQQATIVLEQQADCFAGSWVADVKAGRSKAFGQINPDQLDSTVAGILQLRDQPGSSAVSPAAHGNAFDRVRAFQEGIEQGATRCAGYRAGNLPVTEVPFTTREDAATGGNLPYRDAVKLLGQDVQGYWSRTFPRLANRNWQNLRIVAYDPADAPECNGQTRSEEDATGTAFYCRSGNFVAFDNRQLGPRLYQRIGDNAIGMLLADLFAQAAQDRRGQPTQGRDAQITIDCLAGSWASDLLNRGRNSDIQLSPGDLDEAVAALLVFGRAGNSGDASAFDRIAGFRDGVLEGLPACN
jgi:predicted metalloprotease